MKNIILLLFLFITTLSLSQDNNFVIKDKKKIITLTLENGASAIALHKETKFTISVENIDLKKTAVIGRGIRIVTIENEAQKGYIHYITTIDEKAVVDGTYKILFRYKRKNKAKFYTFLIPVRE